MKRVLNTRFVSAAILFILSLALSAETASLRTRSAGHFGTVEWTAYPERLPAAPVAGVTIPGGNETFPVLAGIRSHSGSTPSVTAAPAAAVPAVYPQEERLGTLNYAGSEALLLSLLWSVSESLGNLKLDPVLCDPARPYIPVLADFRLARLPPVQGVLFSKPQASSTDGQTAVFRLLCRKDAAAVPVYLTVTAAQVSSTWKIIEVLFDGESYAGLAQPY